MNSEILIGLAVAFAAVAVFGRRDSESLPSDLPPVNYDPTSLVMDIPSVEFVSGVSNLSAFLYAIRRSEHRKTDVDSGRDYGIAFGGFEFTDFSDHPTVTGEWMGRHLDAATCRAAGERTGCKSTAAGAYQFRRQTWNEVRESGPWGARLDDFTPASQNEAARRLLMRVGALAALESGDVSRAAQLASSQWASLPWSTSGQPKRSESEFLALFNQGLNQG